MYSCSCCNICVNGFDIEYSGKGISTDLRYGKAIYFSPSLEKAMQYASEGRSVIISKVVLGR